MNAKEFKQKFELIADEIGKEVIGYRGPIEDILIGLFAGGNILLEAAPGLGKTLIGKTLANALNIKYTRVQFTPDLMPADIVGTNIIVEDKNGKKDNSGLLAAWDKAIPEISDKLTASVDYMGTGSAYGSWNFGLIWKFNSKVTAVVGYDTFNNKTLVDTYNVQLTLGLGADPK